MYAYCDDKGFENDRGGGNLTITKIADVFLRDIVAVKFNHENIYRIFWALVKDGYELNEYETYLTSSNRLSNFLQQQDPIEKEDMEFME